MCASIQQMHNEFLLVPGTILSTGDIAVHYQKRESLLLDILVQETDNGQANKFFLKCIIFHVVISAMKKKWE